MPLQIDFVQAAQARAQKAEHAFNNPKDRLDATLAQSVEASSLGRFAAADSCVDAIALEGDAAGFCVAAGLLLRSASCC